ncbi:tyrosyl-tRNA synthetase [Marasmius crinis-equi]|uniref:Tyrosine--tRNA ligase n=1 Tax=Marasmius crinis-equi TaxID=585013 RepID=A0ABR3FKN7_9AGAR
MASQAQVQYYKHGRLRVSGGVLPDAITAYCTYGNPENPCIVFPTCYGGKLNDQVYLIGEDKALDPKKYFIVTFALFSNGESSSPSNTNTPYNGPYFPAVSYEDNIRAQYAVLTKALDVREVFCVIGFSMGGQQAYHWPVIYPEFVKRQKYLFAADISERASPWSFLEGPKAALVASKDFEDGHYKTPPEHGVRAFGRVYSAWAYGQEVERLYLPADTNHKSDRDCQWYRKNKHLHDGMYPDLNAFLREAWELPFIQRWDANDMLTLLHTWQRGDVSIIRDGGDLEKCLGNIKAKGLIMPCRTDLYFPPEDNEAEVGYMKGQGRLVVIDSVWGHVDVTRPEELNASLLSSPRVVYAGIDPTAGSLHIGHLLPLMCLLHFSLRGHTVIPLIGGATGLVGDPSGRKTERSLADAQQVEGNVASLSKGVKQFLQRAFSFAQSRLPAGNQEVSVYTPEVKSNLDWHKDFRMLEFLRNVGRHARVNTMLNRESVRSRLDSKTGLSFTEFTYQLLQAYDFYHLYENHQCTIQIGGSDQWGNIIAGLELIDRIKHDSGGGDAFGITTPLLTTASGEKFGKSAGNAVWLDPEQTSVFDFYQYFLKVEDADVEKHLKLFTMLPVSEVREVMETHQSAPEARTAQRRLADEVTELVHEKTGLEQAQRLTNTMFRTPEARSKQLDAQSLLDAFKGDPRLKWCPKDELTSVSVMKLASKHGLVPSTSAARNLIQSRGLYYNDKPVPELHFTIQENDLLDGRVVVIRAGKDKTIILAAQ